MKPTVKQMPKLWSVSGPMWISGCTGPSVAPI